MSLSVATGATLDEIADAYGLKRLESPLEADAVFRARILQEYERRFGEPPHPHGAPTYDLGTLKAHERRVIEFSLRLHAGDKVQTAAALGISLKTLYNKLNRYAAK